MSMHKFRFSLYTYLENTFFLLSIVFVSCVYLYKLKYFPSFGGDESALNNIPYRAVTFGDIGFPVYYPPDTYNVGFLRGIPFLPFSSLRVLFHVLVGFSAESSRLFSTLLTLLSVLLVVVCCKLWWPKLSPWKMGIMTIVLALTPGMILSARTMRIEQEILFLGSVGIYGLLIFLTRTDFKSLAWILSGVVLGVAAISHPMGSVFSGALVLTLFFHSKAWQCIDAMGTFNRILSWIGGFCIPLFITLSDVLYTPLNFFKFQQGSVAFALIRNQTFIDIFSDQYTGLFQDFFPTNFKSLLYQLGHYSFSTDFLPYYLRYYQIIFFMSIILSLSFLPIFFMKRKNLDLLPLTLSCYLFIGFLFASFLFITSQTYYVYLAFSGSAFLSILYITFPWSLCLKLQFNLSKLFISVPIFLLLFLNLASSFSLFREIRHINENNTLSLDRLYSEQIKIKKLLEYQYPSKGVTLIDPLTWPFSGKDTGSWITTVAGFEPKNVVAAAYRSDSMDFYINVFPTMTRIQSSEQDKRNHYQKVIKKLKLRALLIVPPLNVSHYFYIKDAESGAKFHVSVMGSDAKTLRLISDDNKPTLIKAAQQSPLQTPWLLSHGGYYMLILPSKMENPLGGEVKFFQNGVPLVVERQSQETKDCPSYYLFKAQEGSLVIQNLDLQHIIQFTHLAIVEG